MASIPEYAYTHTHTDTYLHPYIYTFRHPAHLQTPYAPLYSPRLHISMDTHIAPLLDYPLREGDGAIEMICQNEKLLERLAPEHRRDSEVLGSSRLSQAPML